MPGIPLNLSKKVTIQAYKDPEFKSKAMTSGKHNKSGKIKLQINPENITHDHEITTYDSEKDSMYDTDGIPLKAGEFQGVRMETVRFDFHLDATGVVPNPNPLSIMPFSILDWVKDFKELVYKYHGSIHGPYYLKIIWGDLLVDNTKNFQCRLDRLDINYLLFKPDGSPLRARIDCAFKQFMTKAEMLKLANKSSPDMSHVKTVRAGDRLPLLCKEVYGSSSYYLKVARINGLTNIYQLSPGQKLLFPPLEK